LGSKHALSNGNEPEELTGLLSAFEIQDSVRIVLEIRVLEHHKKPDLQLTAKAIEIVLPGGEAVYSDSVSVVRWGSESVTVMGAISTLLYALDFELAEREWDRAKNPRA